MLKFEILYLEMLKEVLNLTMSRSIIPFRKRGMILWILVAQKILKWPERITMWETTTQLQQLNIKEKLTPNIF